MASGISSSAGTSGNISALQLLQARLQQRQNQLAQSLKASTIADPLGSFKAAQSGSLFTALATSIGDQTLSFLNAIGIANEAGATDTTGSSENATVIGAGNFLPDRAAALNGAGTLSPDAAAAVSGTGTLSADGLGVVDGVGTLSADTLGLIDETGPLAADELGSVVGTGTLSADLAAAVSGTGTLSADALGSINGTGTLSADAAAAVSGTGTLAADAAASVNGTGTLAADALGSVNGTGTLAADAAASVNGTGTLNNQSNLDAQGITQGKTLTVKVGTGAVQTITFGILPGQVDTLAALQTALSGLTGLTAASVNTTNGGVALTTSTTAAITIGGTV